jgi:hypothetical protein
MLLKNLKTQMVSLLRRLKNTAAKLKGPKLEFRWVNSPELVKIKSAPIGALFVSAKISLPCESSMLC